MGRTLRIAPADGFFHVTARGNRRQTVFVDDIDRSWFLERLTDVVERFEWNLLAYCLMGNHYHLTVHTPKATLSAGMQRLNGVWAQRFNWRHGFEGHLFERPFRSNLAETDETVQEFTRYTVLNPLRAGLVRAPAEWPWSSYRASAGHVPPPRLLAASRLYELFARPGRDGRAAYVEFITAGLARSGHGSGPGPETRLSETGNGGNGRGDQSAAKRRTTMQALWPPKPNELLQATSRSGASRYSFGM
jgi:REP element-mobilizing transposase RayT